MIILVISPKNRTVYNFRGDLIKDMIASGHSVYVTGPNNDYVDEILSLGINEFIEVPLSKDKTSIKSDLSYSKKLKEVIKRIKPDMVFSYTIKPVVYGSAAAGKLGVKRIYAMVTGLGRVYSSDGLKSSLLKFITKTLYRRGLKYCDKVIFQNPDDKKELLAMGCFDPEKAVIVNGSGVNMDRFVKTELPEKPSFLMIGRLIREKGVAEYLEAARVVKEKYPKAEFYLLGKFEDSLGSMTENDVMPYVNSGVVQLLDEVDDTSGIYSKCNVYVLPSYYREGLPRTILEAMSCGRAVITTDWTGCREAVIDGVNGFLVPVKDSGSLAGKMITLIENRELMERMGENACKICREKYDVTLVNQQMKKIMKY